MKQTNREEIAVLLEGHTEAVRQIVDLLRDLVQEAEPQLVEEPKMGWGNITYKLNGVVCAISPHKNWVNLHFYKGVSLPDPGGILEGSGKALRHVKFIDPQQIRKEKLAPLIRAAVALDREV